MPDTNAGQSAALKALCSQFSDLPDARQAGRIQHPLGEVLMSGLCAVLCGYDSFLGMAEFTSLQLDWLRRFMPMTNGVPSHDTYRTLFSTVNPDAFASILRGWVNDLSGKHVAIDGKVISGTKDSGDRAVCVLRAWVNEVSISAGQVACEEKSNEITAIPKLLNKLELNGVIISIDAAGCQTEIAAQIDAAKGDYVLALKGNQGTAYETAKTHFEQESFTPSDRFKTEERSHGRHEIRICEVENDLKFFGKSWRWAGLTCVARVRSEVWTGKATQGKTDGDEIRIEERYFLCSTEAEAKHILRIVREHWGIENRCHWMLDAIFKEDANRVQDVTAARNQSILREVSLYLLRQDPAKKSMPMKRMRAALDPDYRLSLLKAAHA
jgi:predicted transposase YbfD/YdcC